MRRILNLAERSIVADARRAHDALAKLSRAASQITHSRECFKAADKFDDAARLADNACRRVRIESKNPRLRGLCETLRTRVTRTMNQTQKACDRARKNEGHFSWKDHG